MGCLWCGAVVTQLYLNRRSRSNGGATMSNEEAVEGRRAPLQPSLSQLQYFMSTLKVPARRMHSEPCFSSLSHPQSRTVRKSLFERSFGTLAPGYPQEGDP